MRKLSDFELCISQKHIRGICLKYMLHATIAAKIPMWLNSSIYCDDNTHLFHIEHSYASKFPLPFSQLKNEKKDDRLPMMAPT